MTGNKPRFPAPEGVRISHTGDDLEDLLARGQLDALLAPHPRDSKLPLRERRFRPLLRGVTAVEQAYFSSTGIFPIMHTIVIRDHVHQQWPEAPKVLYDLYAGAKRNALKRRLGTTFLPWTDREWERTPRPFFRATRTLTGSDRKIGARSKQWGAFFSSRSLSRNQSTSTRFLRWEAIAGRQVSPAA